METVPIETKKKRLPALWRIDDALWAKMQPLVPAHRNKRGRGGRPPVEERRVLDGIVYVLRSGCPWKHVPKEFGSGSTCHLHFSRWVKAGIFARLWALLLTEYDELREIDWNWQAGDAALGKAPGIAKKGK